MEMVTNLLGDEYAYQGATTSLTREFKEGPNEALFQMHNKTFVRFVEPESSACESIRSNNIRNLSGDQTINANGKWKSGKNSCKTSLKATFCCDCNKLPLISGDTSGESLQQRLVVIDFPFTFTDREDQLKSDPARKKLRQRGPNPVLIVVVARAPRAPLASASGYYGAPAVTLVRQRARPSVRCSAAPPARARAAPRRIRSHAGAQHRALCARARWLASRRAERAAVRARPSPRRRAQRRHPVLIMCASRTTSAYPQLQASSWPPSSYSPSRPTHLFHMLHMQDSSQLLAVCPCMWLTPW